MAKAGIYVRVSSEEQAEDDKFSISTQLADCQKYCERQGDTVVKIYQDIQSGQDARKDRANFEQMLADAKQGLFEKIVVWRPDRLFRGLSPAAKLARVLDETGVSIEGVQQPLDRNMVGLWAWVAEQEIKTFKERSLAGKRANVKQLGKWPGGLVKFGYRYNANPQSPDFTGKLEKDENEAAVVQSMFQFIAEGGTISGWVKKANKDGTPTKRRSKGWLKSFVSLRLRDTAYTGKGYYGKQTMKGTKLVKGNNLIPMSYTQIISEELFNKVQTRLLENKRRNNGSSKRTYVLQHLGRCAECGGRLCCRTSRGIDYIYCIRQTTFPEQHNCLKPKNLRLKPIEDYIWGEVEDILKNYEDKTYETLLEQFENGKAQRKAQIERIKEEITRCDLEKQRLLTFIRKGRIDEKEADLQFKAIKDDQDYWKQESSKIQSLETNSDVVWENWYKQLQEVRNSFTFWFLPSPEKKKEILNLLLQEFVLSKDGKIELRFKVPVNEKQLTQTIATLSHDVVA